MRGERYPVDEIRGRFSDHSDESSRQRTGERRRWNSDEEDVDTEALNDEEHNSDDVGSDADDSDDSRDEFRSSTVKRQQHTTNRSIKKEALKRNGGFKPREVTSEENSDSEDMFSDSEGAFESDDVEKPQMMMSQGDGYDYLSDDSEDEDHNINRNPTKGVGDEKRIKTPKQVDETWDSDTD